MPNVNLEKLKKDYIEFKIKFKKFDSKLQKNIMIGSMMIFSVVATGLFLALIAIVRFGEKMIEAKIALQ